MNSRRTDDPEELLPTRRSLIERLRDLDDQPSWREFFDKAMGAMQLRGRQAPVEVYAVRRSVPELRQNEPEKEEIRV